MIVNPCGNMNCGPMVKREFLNIVYYYDYVGIVINNDLTYTSFMKKKCYRMNIRIYQLGKLRKYITIIFACLISKQTVLKRFWVQNILYFLILCRTRNKHNYKAKMY